MTGNNSKALIVSYYLSKFDRIAYRELGFATQIATHSAIGEILDVNPNTVKNMRDEFDSIHDNSRMGWWQRPIRPSRERIIELFEHLEEPELRDVIYEIINPVDNKNAELNKTVENIEKLEKHDNKRSERGYVNRATTGRLAEQFFQEHYRKKGQPVRGELFDRRDDGCGFDFEIISNDVSIKIEVKGLSGAKGGVQFTSKEWDVAKKSGDNYFLAIIKNVESYPSLLFIQNPFKNLEAQKSIHTTIQVRWNVTANQLFG